MPALPTGTVTYLFTDVEGSTRLWEQHPRAMGAALARHDALIEQAVARHGGALVRPRGEGDSRFAVFARASDAVAAAADLQRALQAEPWPTPTPLRVRVALHTGEADVREGDYYGTAVNRCARLRALAHGGQTLLSQATAQLVRDGLPPGVGLADLGAHRLKDLAEPERVYQLVVAGLPADFPPLAALDARPNNLPVQPTPLVGRAAELAAVAALLRRADVRLVTLTGPGGTGKTRLGLQVAAELLEEYADGVWFVDLAPLADPALVPSAIAQAVGVKEAGGRPLLAELVAALGDRQELLLLDNFEQVVAAAPLVAELLAACPALTVLATSRSVLHLRGEHAVAVPPLAVPDLEALPPPDRLRQYAGVQLFVARAQAARADFRLTDENGPAVAAICARLDGLPLAIELAAARVRLLPPAALLARLGGGLGLLTGGARDLPARQRTLRATMAWSHDLLAPGERTVFRRLAVFVGGGTLEAVEAVVTGAGDLPGDLLEGLEGLAENSLLRQVEQPDGQPRFQMLETIREYALERLAESGESEALRQAHADHFLRLAEAAEPQLRGARQVPWLARLEMEHDNLRAALGWAVERGATELGLRLGGALWRFWWVHGHLTEGRERLAELLGLAGAAARTLGRAKALMGAGALAFYRVDYAVAGALLEESLAISREVGDRPGVAWSLLYLGWIANDRGDYAAARLRLEESLALFGDLGDQQGIAWALARLGLVDLFEGELGAAGPRLEESLAMCRRLGDRWGTAWSLHLLAQVVSLQGDAAGAHALDMESATIWRELGDQRNLAYSLFTLGLFAFRQGDLAAARASGGEALAISADLGDQFAICFELVLLALVSAALGQAERAVRLDGATAALREAIGAGVPAPLAAIAEPALAAARQALSEAAQAAAWAEGRAMTLEQAIAEALRPPPV